MDQPTVEVTFGEAKSQIRNQIKKNWKDNHPQHNSKDDIYSLSRKEQTTIFCLRTGHNKLRHHMHRIFKIGDNGQCPCGAANETTDHVLQDCVKYRDQRREIWGSGVALDVKLYGPLPELQRTLEFLDKAKLNP